MVRSRCLLAALVAAGPAVPSLAGPVGANPVLSATSASAQAAVVAPLLAGSRSVPEGALAIASESTTLKTITSAGYTIEVPSSLPVRAASRCGDKGPAVITGPFNEVDGCMPLTPVGGTTVLFGSDGPPLSPIPTDFAGDETFNGVSVQVLVGSDAILGGSYLLAFLPGRASWLFMGAPGKSPEPALAEARRILATVKVANGSPHAPLVRPAQGVFVGQWHVHDAILQVISDETGVISAQGGCQCSEADTLSLSLSTDKAQMSAVVVATRTTNASGQVVAEPHPNELKGQKSFFEFMEPHLMLQVTVPNEPVDLGQSFGNPYWCGEQLSERFNDACGA